MSGWQCPGCGRCYAPFVSQCESCNPDNVRTASHVTLRPVTLPVPAHNCHSSTTAARCDMCGGPVPL
jgi:hypothetical protein